MTYRGNYPTKIIAVWTGRYLPGIAAVQLNDGRIFHVPGTTTKGRLPELGQDIAQYAAAYLAPPEFMRRKPAPPADNNRSQP